MGARVIHLQALAPAKPDRTAPCNGCGVCCVAEPCPVGMLISRQRSGACQALRWDEATARYRCGVVAQPEDFLPGALKAAAPLLRRVALRLISSGSGCDCDYETEAGPAAP
ncbi:hypothetical protein C7444_11149 [Sphaerotilus hippei]|uniref:4Fe-4S ferredoxin-type domain-containing protein n=1 Tax=Sphaerotilus hippei TaxID=744406 RepID=A0A318H6E1_9BURK|nr:hypothetical protein [Sphaerotilus hippei]PXW94966.1 hypothetical protein C7444_11149 [Sphaerotilus hippei]